MKKQKGRSFQVSREYRNRKLLLFSSVLWQAASLLERLLALLFSLVYSWHRDVICSDFSKIVYLLTIATLKITPKSNDLNLLSSSFCRSRTWEWLCWVWVFHKATIEVPDEAAEISRLNSRVIFLQAHTHGCWSDSIFLRLLA